MFARMNANQFAGPLLLPAASGGFWSAFPTTISQSLTGAGWLTPSALTRGVSPWVKWLSPGLPSKIGQHVLPSQVASGTLSGLRSLGVKGIASAAAVPAAGAALGIGAWKYMHPEDYEFITNPKTWKKAAAEAAELIGAEPAGKGSRLPWLSQLVVPGGPLTYVAGRMPPYTPKQSSLGKSYEIGLPATVAQGLLGREIEYRDGIPYFKGTEIEFYGDKGLGKAPTAGDIVNVYFTGKTPGGGNVDIPPEVPPDFWDKLGAWVEKNPLAAAGLGIGGGLVISKAFD
jgi:hypothetical protein